MCSCRINIDLCRKDMKTIVLECIASRKNISELNFYERGEPKIVTLPNSSKVNGRAFIIV